MKKEYLKKGFKDVFGAAGKAALKQCIWVIPTLGLLSLMQAKGYELEAEEQEKVPVEETAEAPVEETTDEVQEVSGQQGDENLKNYESDLEEE